MTYLGRILATVKLALALAVSGLSGSAALSGATLGTAAAPFGATGPVAAVVLGASAVAGGLALTVPRTAAAQAKQAGLIAAGGDDRLPEVWTSRVLGRAVALLKERGLTVIDAKALNRRLKQAGAVPCDTTRCAGAAAKRLGLDFIIAVSLWSDMAGREPKAVAVSLVAPDGQQYPGDAVISTQSDWPDAVASALEGALDGFALGATRVLVVRGEPEGALVTIDGTPEGVLPYRKPLGPGQHEVVVSLEGYVSDTRTIDLSGDDAQEVVLTVHLSPAPPGEPGVAHDPPPALPGVTTASLEPELDATTATPTKARQGIHWGHTLGAGTLGLAGGALIVAAFVGGGTDCDTLGPDGTCLSGSEANPGVRLAYGLSGMALLAGAATWATIRIIKRERAQSSTEVSVSPGGLTLKHTF